jgi:hypothetical protein
MRPRSGGPAGSSSKQQEDDSSHDPPSDQPSRSRHGDVAETSEAGKAARPVCFLERSRDIALRETDLQRRALRVVIIGLRPMVTADLLAEEVAAEFDLDPTTFSVDPSTPEDFVLILQNEQVALQVYNNGAVLRCPSGSFKFMRWLRFAQAEVASLSATVSVAFRGVPMHAWKMDTARNLLHRHCSALELHPDTAACRDFSCFKVTGWCRLTKFRAWWIF